MQPGFCTSATRCDTLLRQQLTLLLNCCMQFGDVARLVANSPQIYQYQQMSLGEYLDSLQDPEPKYYAARLELQVRCGSHAAQTLLRCLPCTSQAHNYTE